MKISKIVSEYEREACRLAPDSIIAAEVRLRLAVMKFNREIKRNANLIRK